MHKNMMALRFVLLADGNLRKISARIKKEKIAWVKIEKTPRLAEERFGRV